MKGKALDTRFIADSMLGKLAKWLRLAGVDVEYENDIDDFTLVQRAISEGRVILTRDRFIAKRKDAKDCFIIRSDHLAEQFLEFLRAFELDTIDNAFTRCIRCNATLEEAAKDSLRDKVPPYVWETHTQFLRCRHCKRVYWAGTHRDNAEKFLKKMIADLENHS